MEPITRFGVRPFHPPFAPFAPFPPTLSRHRHFIASPASITASLDPTVDTPPTAVDGSSSRRFSAWNRSATMHTHRCSIAAVTGYSSLSIMFLSNVSDIS